LLIPLKERIGDEKEAQRQGEDRVTSGITLLHQKEYIRKI
jgi:hypothetical protein